MNTLVQYDDENNVSSGIQGISLEEALGSSENNPLVSLLRKAGKTDTLLHVGKQLKTSDVVGKVLTISRVGIAGAPAYDAEGEPIWETDEDGNIATNEHGQAVQRINKYPVFIFAEAPGYYYNAGAMGMGIVSTIAEAAGDDMDDNMLPRSNDLIKSAGGIRAYFDWKKKVGSGQRYVNIIVC